MTWSDFFLICFAVGFGFSFFSFVFGSGNGRLHFPHFHGHGIAHLPAAHGAAASGPVAHAPAAHAGTAAATATQATTTAAPGTRGGVSPFNLVTLAAFLAWFGGTGFLLTRYSTLWVGFSLLASIAVGMIGGSIVFLFMSKVLISYDENMDPADYEMIGVLGKLCNAIREGGTGELLYSQMGTRRVCGARSESGAAIAKGTEVVVTRYDKGIAYVRRWDEISNE